MPAPPDDWKETTVRGYSGPSFERGKYLLLSRREPLESDPERTWLRWGLFLGGNVMTRVAEINLPGSPEDKAGESDADQTFAAQSAADAFIRQAGDK